MNTNEHEFFERLDRGCVCKTSRSGNEFLGTSRFDWMPERLGVVRLVPRTQPRSPG